MRKSLGISRMRLRFRRSQKPGSYVHRARAKYQRRSDSARVGDPARSDHRHRDRIRNLRQERHQTDHLPFRFICAEGSPVSPCLHALRDNRIGACRFRRFRFSNRRSGREPQDSACFHFGHEARRIDSHNRRDGLWGYSQQGLALSLKIRQLHVTRFRWNRRSPRRKKLALPFFQFEVSHRRRLWNPKINLKSSRTALSEFVAPCFDFIRLQQQRPASSKPASIRHSNRQRRRACPRHRRQQDGQTNTKTIRESLGTRPRAMNDCLATITKTLRLDITFHFMHPAFVAQVPPDRFWIGMT